MTPAVLTGAVKFDATVLKTLRAANRLLRLSTYRLSVVLNQGVD